MRDLLLNVRQNLWHNSCIYFAQFMHKLEKERCIIRKIFRGQCFEIRCYDGTGTFENLGNFNFAVIRNMTKRGLWTNRMSCDDMYAGVLNKISKKLKIIVRLGTFTSTIIACSNSVIAVVFSNTRTMSFSLHTSFRISVNIVTTNDAFWCVSRRCADKKLFIIFSKMNCNVADLQWRAHVMNGFEIVFCTVI